MRDKGFRWTWVILIGLFFGSVDANLAVLRAEDVEGCLEGDAEAAIKGCSRIIKSGRLFGEPIDGEILAVIYLSRGGAYYEKEEYDRAIADYTKAIELDPEDAGSYYNRGISYNKKEEYDRAIADSTKAIELDPKDADAYNNRGVAYSKKEEYDRAIADYSKAIEFNPNYASAHNNRAWSYYKWGKAEKGLPDANKAVELDPNYASARDTRGYIFEATGEREKAIADYRKALELDPSIEGSKAGLERLTAAASTKLSPPKPAPSTKTVGEADVVTKKMDMTFWSSIKDSNDPAMFQAYLDQFPKGTFAALAKIKISKLKKGR